MQTRRREYGNADENENVLLINYNVLIRDTIWKILKQFWTRRNKFQLKFDDPKFTIRDARIRHLLFHRNKITWTIFISAIFLETIIRY